VKTLVFQSNKMSQLKQLQNLSEYNQLMNQRLYKATGELSATKLKENRGAFFGSLLGTLNHIVVGDIIWLKRFAVHPSSKKALSYFTHISQPTSLDTILFENFKQLEKERQQIDKIIISWINSLQEEELHSSLAYNNVKGLPFKKEFASLINHFFLHQVHHRGQATVLLSQYGIDFGDTDIIEILEEIQ